MRPIRVVIVDDSAFMRKIIGDILASDSGIEVVAKGRNGQEAIELVDRCKPDVITLDIEMPVMNGLDALSTIMKTRPLPVLMLSSLTKQGAVETIRALEMGAVDFISKPSGAISLDLHKVGADIIKKVKAAAQVNVTHLRKGSEMLSRIRQRSTASMTDNQQAFISATNPTPFIKTPTTFMAGTKKADYSAQGNIGHLIVVGTSTGGPKALQVLLSGLPANLNGALVIVQHMPAGFTRSLAQRLNSLCEINVMEAEDNQPLRKGCAYIAPGNYHMEVCQKPDGTLYLSLNQKEPRAGHRPSVDMLFESVAKLPYSAKHAIIMTGMGSDGTVGLKALKETGIRTVIAEDESTCIVFGMPRAAIQAGIVDKVVPLHEISDQLIRCLNC